MFVGASALDNVSRCELLHNCSFQLQRKEESVQQLKRQLRSDQAELDQAEAERMEAEGVQVLALRSAPGIAVTVNEQSAP
jgi:hypothetical protein